MVCGLLWFGMVVCYWHITTSLWACSIEGHRIDRTLQLQPEAEFKPLWNHDYHHHQQQQQRQFSPWKLKETLRQIWFLSSWNPTKSNWHCESPKHAAYVTYLQLLPYPNQKDSQNEEIQSDIISAHQTKICFPCFEKTKKNKSNKNNKTKQLLNLSSFFPFAHSPPQSPLTKTYENHWQLGRLDVQRLSQIP